MVGNIVARIGIIPTRMGTRAADNPLMSLPEDHPHAYGDKQGLKHFDTVADGSSPRVWGQESVWLSIVQTTRIIPTRMGTSSKNFIPIYVLKDHPHAYGDKYRWTSDRSCGTGSSPRVWGQVKMNGIIVLVLRIIPTRMGTSVRLISPIAGFRDHPHAYGDKLTLY